MAETPDDMPVEEGEDEEGKLDSPHSADNPRTPSGIPTKHPIILVHGFASSPTLNGFKSEVWGALCRDGHSVYVPELPAFASSERRAEVLDTWVGWVLDGATDWCGRTPTVKPTKVNLIAHSMGGLDSRIVATKRGAQIASVVTLASPHRGTKIADMMLGLTGGFDAAARSGLEQYAKTKLDPNSPDLRGAFISLAEASAAENERKYPLPDPSITVFESWAGLSNVFGIANPRDWPACENKMSLFPVGGGRHSISALLKPIAAIVAHGVELRPNDGIVSVASSKWGTFRGCMPADHADEVGAFPRPRFDYLRFIRNRAFDLSARGL